MESPEPAIQVLVLGIGNLLWADEAFGVRAVEELHRSYSFPEGVVLLDGGTQGLYLVDYVKRAKRLLVFDAIDYGEPPGTLKLVRDDQVPRFMGVKKLSLHQTGFQEVLSAAQLLGSYPRSLLLIGVQAKELDDWGGGLTDEVRRQIEPAIQHGLDQLKEWGFPAQARPEPLPESEGLLVHGLDIASFEGRGT